MPQTYFYMCTDEASVEKIRRQLDDSTLDIMETQISEHQKQQLLEKLAVPTNNGSIHLREM